MAGLTATGFTPKSFTEIKAAVNEKLKPTFGAGVETDSDSIFALKRNALVLELAGLWEAVEALYNQRGINNAEGIQLDNEISVVGVTRKVATYSIVEVEVEGAESTVIPQYTQLSVASTGEIFQTLIEYILPAPGSQPLEITMQAVTKGAIACLAEELTGTLPTGVTLMINPADAIIGNEAETDEEVKSEYAANLAKIGGASIPAITAALNAITAVNNALLRENVTGIVDGNGLAPHSFQAIVSGGTDVEVAETIFDKKAAGIETNGAESEVVAYNGQNFTIKFDRPSPVLIYVLVDVTAVDGDFPSNGDQLIEDNVLAYGDTMVANKDVLLAKMQNAVTDVPGIVTYTIKFDTITPPVNQTANLTIDLAEAADFDSTRITVNVP